MQKIKNIQSYPCITPQGEELLFVRLETTGGVVGVGEAGLKGRGSEIKSLIDTVLAPDLEGRDVSCANYIEERFFPKKELENESLRRAVSGVEIACWDALGKMLDVPVYKLLGGMGYPALPQVSDQKQKRQTELVRVLIQADCYPGKPIMNAFRQYQEDGRPQVIEIEGHMGKKHMLSFLGALQKLNPWYVCGVLELNDTESWDEIVHAARVPLAARLSSRFEAFPLAETSCMSVVEADILSSGGIGALKLLASYLETYYIRLAAACTGSLVSAAAAAHTLYSCPNSYGVCLPSADVGDIVCGDLDMEKVGLGVEVNWSKLR